MLLNKMNLRRKRFAASLFISTAIVSLAASTPVMAQYSEQQSINAYSRSGYQYCDAKLVANLWNVDIWQGKIGIGEKILAGIGDNIPYVLELSRNEGNRCDWGDTGFEYDDAVKIANLWNLSGVAEAKSKIALLATRGQSGYIRQALAAPVATPPYSAQGSEQQYFDAYAQSQYVYCDAKLVADYMGMSVEQGKVEIGAKILGGIGQTIPQLLQQSRDNGNKCYWSDTGFSYQDAERVAAMWNLSSVEEAKTHIAIYVTNGNTDYVNRVLGY